MAATPDRFPPRSIPAQAVTGGPRHHFFGYYDKSPWDDSGRWLLGMSSAFMDRPPGPDDAVVIGLIDCAGGHVWRPLAETRAWNWQQGCMLQWLGGGRTGEIIFNDRRDGRFVSRIVDVNTGRERVIDRPVYAVNRAGTHAVSLNFARLADQRPGYGYAGASDPWREDPAPADDGLHAIDLATGRSQLILSVAAAAAWRPHPEFAGAVHRFNHAQFSPGGRRFAVLHRWKRSPDEEVGRTRLLTLEVDGGGLDCAADDGFVSHYDWRDDERILAWASQPGRGNHYYLFGPGGAPPPTMGETVFDCDGHCSFSPDRRWVLTDTYPDRTQHRTLILLHWETQQRTDIGRFLSPTTRWDIRCDLHPRWSPDGQKICLDSVHEGTRQMYVLDVGGIVSAAHA
ncbi:MAG TPA: hypothetical protein VHE13_16280 [Opitutus sp.]|nr:hypothetical protein [Opitutus sp.]